MMKELKKNNQKVAVYDPGFREVGHHLGFDLNVLRVLSKFFHEVLFFERNGIVRDKFLDKPINVEIIQIPDKENERVKIDSYINTLKKSNKSFSEKKNLVKEAETNIYKKLWEFIDLYDCDLLLFTSEGSLGNPLSNSFFISPPPIPFFVCIHIIWHVLRKSDDNDLRTGLSKAQCLFALEDNLAEKLSDFNGRTYRFPYIIYDNEIYWEEKAISSPIKIGTIGVINDRRNVDFIINSLSKYNGKSLEYYLCGKPLGKCGDEIQTLVGKFSNKASVSINSKFEYLTDDEFDRLITECHFLLIAYDEVRIHQAPGIVYQAAKNGTPLIVPEIELFKLVEQNYPGIFVFYDNLSTESLNNILSELSKMDDYFKDSLHRSQQSMKRFLIDNSENVQYEYLNSIFKDLDKKLQIKAIVGDPFLAAVQSLINSLCLKNEKFKDVFIPEIQKQIINSTSLLETIKKDFGLRKIIADNNIRIDDFVSFLEQFLISDDETFNRLCNEDIIECILNDVDLLPKVCSTDQFSSIFWCDYNAKSRTDKFYGFWGKLIGAFEIHKAVNEWETVDKPKLESLKNIHKGDRAFIICNGPSLNEIDLDLLKDEITIGTNGLYLSFGKSDFRPTYYLVEDDLVAEDRAEDLSNINGPLKLFAQRLAYCLQRDEDVIFLRHCPNSNPWNLEQKYNIGLEMPFSPDISVVSFGGNTVTYTCLQLAYHLGVREVFIIGADHNFIVPDRYSEKDIDENYVIESQEDDANHFNQDYFGKGFRWHNPKVHKLEKSYRNARQFFEFNGGMIFNATVGGHLEVFDRIPFLDLFKNDFQNLQFQYFLNNYKKKQLGHFDYNNDFIEFDGTFELQRSFEPVNDSWAVEIVLNSACHEDDYSTFNKKSPPTPLNLKTLSIFQTSKEVYRIKALDFNCSLKFNADTWNKIKIFFNKKSNELHFYLNNHLIRSYDCPDFPISGLFVLGKGTYQRFWKGKIGYANLFSGDELKKSVLLVDRVSEIRDQQAKLTGELQKQIEQLTKARDEQAKLANERQVQITKLSKEFDQQMKVVAEVKNQLRQTQRISQEKDKRMMDMETKLAETAKRQDLLDEEIIKAEAQVNLLKDVLLREPGL
ncbi:6-hydroxymethylpterin diphosphokinase MptE-like protein [Thermodesulfobacteriota bacterium]